MGEEHSAAKGVFILSVAGMVAKFISVFYSPILVSILDFYLFMQSPVWEHNLQ